MKNTQKIILSFAFVLGIAFFTHYFFVQRIETKENGTDRDVASFGERNSGPQIKWEQKIAEELSDSKTTQASVKPNWHDLLVYEYLSGQYDISVHQGRIEKMQLQSTMSGVKFMTKDFIEKYGRKMKNFVTYKIDSENAHLEVVRLYDQQGADAGTVKIERSDEGLVQNILIQ